MEKVWEELKKIEAHAQEIRSQAQSSAKEITALAQKEAERLVADSEVNAKEEAEQFYTRTVDQANLTRTYQLQKNEAAIEKLGLQAENRMDKATTAIFDVVLGEKV